MQINVHAITYSMSRYYNEFHLLNRLQINYKRSVYVYIQYYIKVYTYKIGITESSLECAVFGGSWHCRLWRYQYTDINNKYQINLTSIKIRQKIMWPSQILLKFIYKFIHIWVPVSIRMCNKGELRYCS